MPDKKPVTAVKDNPGWKKLGGKSERTKEIRAAGPRGFLKAICVANLPQELKLTI